MPIRVDFNGVIVSSFQTILCFDTNKEQLYLAKLGDYPEDKFVRLEGNCFYALQDNGRKYVIPFDDVMYPGGAGRLAFVKEGRFLTGRPDGSVGFFAKRIDTWEKFDFLSEDKARLKAWTPLEASGGTELTLKGLRACLGAELEEVDLKLNTGWKAQNKTKPRIVWIHNDLNPSYEVFSDKEFVDEIDKFVFVSNWQRSRFLARFDLPTEKCSVIYNGINIGVPGTQWATSNPWRIRCAYVSDPGRGLDTLIKVWKLLDPENAELHIWSGTRLWGAEANDQRYYHLFAEAADTRNIFYHGISNNQTIRKALQEMHFLLMPSDFLETFCISAVEALASGCRVLAPAIGALPEVVGEFGHLYEHKVEKQDHIETFAEIVRKEFQMPWQGDMGVRANQIKHVNQKYSWEVIQRQWRKLISNLI